MNNEPTKQFWTGVADPALERLFDIPIPTSPVDLSPLFNMGLLTDTSLNSLSYYIQLSSEDHATLRALTNDMHIVEWAKQASERIAALERDLDFALKANAELAAKVPLQVARFM